MKPAIALATAVAALAQQPQSIRGFAPVRLAEQKLLEERFRQLPDPARARVYMKRMASEPHHAGSPGSRTVAHYALGLFKEWGYEARIEEFEALLPYPTSRSVEMLSPVPYRARMAEPVLGDDPDSGDRNQLPTYNAYSASGDVTAPLVYVNYGVPADYATLERLGVGVKGKVVIARYGQSWRGTKAKAAQENGALACLIYSDPREDGYWQGDVFPKGPYRPADSAQRGSVMDMPVYVGDPLSPGWASEKGSRRLAIDEATTVMKIPVLPLSQADAQPLLAQLGGPLAPAEWRGALPLTYHIGPGEATVRVRASFDNGTRPVLNVVARMSGAALPDEWVIYGNHHDAWVNGAADPISGAVGLMETARAMAELRKSGWKPQRTLIFALWDAEEFGLIGSTEWVEKHATDLRGKAVAYFNSDMNTGGGFSSGGSPILEQFLRQVMRDVRDPVSGATLLSAAEAADKPYRLSPPGAGSDYVGFIHHLGIAGLNLGFTSPGSQGTYHSIYDSYAWFARHMDKEFRYSRALANVMGTAMVRMSEASILPHEFGGLHASLAAYLDDLKKTHSKLPLAPVAEQVEVLKDRVARFQQTYESALPRTATAPRLALAALNAELAASERVLTRREGLPGRPWYKHQIYAPGLYTGYSARTLPGVREPADLGRMDEAAAQVQVLADTLRALNAHVEKLTTLLGQL